MNIELIAEYFPTMNHQPEDIQKEYCDYLDELEKKEARRYEQEQRDTALSIELEDFDYEIE